MVSFLYFNENPNTPNKLSVLKVSLQQLRVDDYLIPRKQTRTKTGTGSARSFPCSFQFSLVLFCFVLSCSLLLQNKKCFLCEKLIVTSLNKTQFTRNGEEKSEIV